METPDLDFKASRLDCGASRPPAFLWLSFPHSATQLDKCGTDLLPGVPSFSARAFLKGLAKVWEAAVSPLGGLQWNHIDLTRLGTDDGAADSTRETDTCNPVKTFRRFEIFIESEIFWT